MFPSEPKWVECPAVGRPFPPHYVEASRRLLARTLESFDFSARMLARMAMARFPDHAAEAEALGAELGVSEVDLFLGNISYDLIIAFACSTMALATDRGPVLARNMDWFPEEEIARASCIVATPNGRQAGFVGAIGVVSGISDNGFALALNAVSGGEPNLDGYPMLLFLRKVLDEAAGYDDALDMLSRTPLASPGLIALVGTRNEERAVVERLPDRAVVRAAEGDGPLLVTNHYRGIEPPEDFCDRYNCLARTAPRLGRDPSDGELLAVLTDERVLQTITAQHVIIRPAAGELRLFVPRRLVG